MRWEPTAHGIGMRRILGGRKFMVHSPVEMLLL